MSCDSRKIMYIHTQLLKIVLLENSSSGLIIIKRKRQGGGHEKRDHGGTMFPISVILAKDRVVFTDIRKKRK